MEAIYTALSEGRVPQVTPKNARQILAQNHPRKPEFPELSEPGCQMCDVAIA